jgi:23S rRNA (pseudouridine1915-N3)-methyltransferase
VHLRVIAVGSRMPAWVDTAFEDYSRRLVGTWKLELKVVSPANRREAGDNAEAAKAHEARRILALLAPRDWPVALDERGEQFNTIELARWLEQLRGAGQPIVFIIGGPDGVAPEVLSRARRLWSLSRLTLPHALVRVVLAEQIYRAATVVAGHPYHRV